MVSLLSQYGPSRLCKNLILGWSIWVNLTFRILTCKWLEYKDKFNTCIAFHWIQGFTSVMFYQILDFIQRNQSNLCRFTTNLRKLKQFKIFLQKKKEFMFTICITVGFQPSKNVVVRPQVLSNSDTYFHALLLISLCFFI